MRVTATIFVLGKVSMPWKDKENNEHISYSINFMQGNGEIVDRLKLSEKQFNQIIVKKEYVITADYGTGSNGAYLRLLNIEEKK